MSGIAGYIRTTESPDSELLGRMADTIRYGETGRLDTWEDVTAGLCLVTHPPRGKTLPPQPVFNADKSLAVMLLGRIYGYDGLKKELIKSGHEFLHEDSDAEFVLRLYEEIGEKAFAALNGTFCLAVYNTRSRELLLVNDRFGSYALYYHLDTNGALLFGTQVYSILQSKELTPKLNIDAVYEFFALQRVLGTKTYYQDIHYLLPATVLRYRDGTISFDTYFQRIYHEEERSENYYAGKLTELLKTVVARKTKGDYRYGILLSGGMDSRVILAASENSPVCFTVGDYENREVKTAKIIAAAAGSKHVVLTRGADHYADMLDESVAIGDGMYSFEHSHFIGFFDRFKEECDVLMHGNVPEVLLRGANLPSGKNIFSMKYPIKLSENTLAETFLRHKKYSVFKRHPEKLFRESHASVMKERVLNSLNEVFKGADNFVEHLSDKYLWPETYYISRAPTFLNDSHLRAYMNPCASLLLDNDILDLHLKMPPSMRATTRIWNKALERLSPEIAAIPDANTGLSPVVNPVIGYLYTRYRKTKEKLVRLLRPGKVAHPSHVEGSWPNFARLIRHNKKLSDRLYKTINDPKCLDPDIFNIEQINEMFADHMSGKANHKFFLLLILTYGSR
jgi:asparagine synthase (glutamine-hydrolysing)